MINSYDAVIALPNLMAADGTINKETKDRIDAAVELVLQKNAPKILVTGWNYREDSEICISDAMSWYILNRYPLEPSDVLIERMSRDTVGDAVFSRLNLDELLLQGSICVVTSDYHHFRANEIFKFVYGNSVNVDVIGIPTENKGNISDKETESLKSFRNTFSEILRGDIINIYNTLSQKHPYYNGQIHPAIG
jgi:uncharacterized SAM-binding protein YcdF (DUF218 family)